MVRWQLIPAVIGLGRSGDEQLREERIQFHIWLAGAAFQVECRTPNPRTAGSMTTGSMSFADIAGDVRKVKDELNRLTGLKSAAAHQVLVVDLSFNPYVLLREELLECIAQTVGRWLAGSKNRHAAILIPDFPASRSLLWSTFRDQNAATLTGLAIISNSGRVRRGGSLQLMETPLEGYEQHRRAAVRESLQSLESYFVRRLGHYALNGPQDPRCARFFFDGSSAKEPLIERLRQALTQMKDRTGALTTVLSHGGRSPWLETAALSAAFAVDARFIVQLADDLKTISPESIHDGPAALIVDVSRNGETLDSVVDVLHDLGTRLQEPVHVVVGDPQVFPPDGRATRTTPAGHRYTVQALWVTDTGSVDSDNCPQCRLGIPRTDPEIPEDYRLSPFDMWDQLLSTAWGEEEYGPKGRPLLREAPRLGRLFSQSGGWVAYKIDLLLTSLGIGDELALVFPDEKDIKLLVEAMRPIMHNRLVAVPVPRDVLDHLADGRSTRSELAEQVWVKQLDSLGRTSQEPLTPIVILDEFNASGTTAGRLVTLLRQFELVPTAYVCVINRVPGTDALGIPIYALYEIPSPREN